MEASSPRYGPGLVEQADDYLVTAGRVGDIVGQLFYLLRSKVIDVLF